jgi:diguanylate cyclase (GGDEF)-like protein
VEDAMREGWSLRERWCARRDGSRYWCQIMVAANREAAPADPEVPRNLPLTYPAVAGFAVVLRDVTERRVSGEELRRLLTTDHLTGATNRARFFEVAKIEIMRCQASGQLLSAIMLDVDHFKQVNDCFGHSGGDILLQQLVTLCRAQLRVRDVLARLGGEEFAILLPETDLAEAVTIAERIRRSVAADLAFPSSVCMSSDRTLDRITVSLGCAVIGPPKGTIDGLLKAADEALYDAKRGGRDQVQAAVQDSLIQPH